jgi:hypothetical protein
MILLLKIYKYDTISYFFIIINLDDLSGYV